MHNSKSKNRQFGLTLLEVLFASALGVVVIFGATDSMMALTSSSGIQRSRSEMQNTADLALSYISSRLRNSLSTPCTQIDSLKRLNINNLVGGEDSNAMTPNDEAQAKLLISGHGVGISRTNLTLQGLDSATTSSLLATPTTDNISMIAANDKLFLNGNTGIKTESTAESTLQIAGLFPPSSTDEGKKSDPTKEKYSIYAVTNCKSMDVFRANRTINVSDRSTTLTTLPGTSFSLNYKGTDAAMVSRMSLSTIGIDASGSMYDRAMYGGVPGNSLIDGIELMRILFAVDTSGDGVTNRYITAAELNTEDTNNHIIGAEVFILVKSKNAERSVPNSYEIQIPNTSGEYLNSGALPVDTYRFNDQVMRKVFSRKITFRNKASL